MKKRENILNKYTHKPCILEIFLFFFSIEIIKEGWIFKGADRTEIGYMWHKILFVAAEKIFSLLVFNCLFRIQFIVAIENIFFFIIYSITCQPSIAFTCPRIFISKWEGEM